MRECLLRQPRLGFPRPKEGKSRSVQEVVLCSNAARPILAMRLMLVHVEVPTSDADTDGGTIEFFPTSWKYFENCCAPVPSCNSTAYV